jgi:hypothetical protein
MACSWCSSSSAPQAGEAFEINGSWIAVDEAFTPICSQLDDVEAIMLRHPAEPLEGMVIPHEVVRGFDIHIGHEGVAQYAEDSDSPALETGDLVADVLCGDADRLHAHRYRLRVSLCVWDMKALVIARGKAHFDKEDLFSANPPECLI